MSSGSDSSVLTGGHASLFDRQPGKVRRILCGGDDGHTVFIGGPSSLLLPLPPLVSAEVKGRAGTFLEITVWNIKDHADAGAIQTILLPPDAGTSILDMMW